MMVKMETIKIHSKEKFNIEVKDLSKHMPVLDAILHYCEKYNLEYETAASLISTDLKRSLRGEAEELNFIPKSSRLPI